VTDHRARIQGAASAVLEPGEPVLAATRAATEGSALGILGGVALILALSAEHRSRANAQGFPASMNMILAVTDRRLLVFQARSLRRARFRGEVAFDQLRDISVQRRGLSPRLRFELASGAEVRFTTYRTDHPEAFAEAANRARRARVESSLAVPPPPAIPAVLPPPPPR